MTSKHQQELAKLAITILSHFGKLRAYGEEDAEVVEVQKGGLFVRFKVWHSKRIVSKRPITCVIVEAIFVKRVSNRSFLALQKKYLKSIRF